MRSRVLIDTGPLVALLKKRDQYHAWAASTVENIRPPLLTCEPVITETCFLLRQIDGTHEIVMDLMADGYLDVDFSLKDEAIAIKTLMTRYQSVPMSLADACLVRMAEYYKNSTVMTLDSDFQIYRINRNQPIPLLMPTGL